MTIYMPYVYLIGWAEFDTWYIGSRVAKGCHPDEFWKEETRSRRSYNGSSKYVDRFIEEHGQPDYKSVVATFDTKEGARWYEKELIWMTGAVRSPLLLNKHEPGEKFVGCGGPKSEKHKANWSLSIKEVWSDPELRERQSKSQKVVQTRQDVKDKKSSTTTDNWANPEIRERMLAAQSNPELRARKSTIMKEVWNDPELRERQSKSQKEVRADPEFKIRFKAIMKEVWNDPELRARKSAMMKEIWRLRKLKSTPTLEGFIDGT